MFESRQAVVDAALGTILPPRCVSCAVPLTTIAGHDDDDGWCAACREQLIPSDPPGLFLYAGPIAALVQRAKYSRDLGSAAALCALMADHLDPAVGAVDVATFVPAHWTRALWRGFDLPGLLADRAARRLGVPCRGLLRAGRRDPRLATTTSVDERARLVAGRFKATSSLADLRVLLIDDVHTTGATVGEATSALRAGGARDVVVRTLALTPATR